jgi:hypothetical protein
MKNGRWITTVAVSLYVLFFLVAFWSVLPASLTGSTGGLAQIVDEHLATCELGTGPAADQKYLNFQAKENVGTMVDKWYSGFVGAWKGNAYECALLTGGSFN